jgi:hypothetical protein
MAPVPEIRSKIITHAVLKSPVFNIVKIIEFYYIHTFAIHFMVLFCFCCHLLKSSRIKIDKYARRVVSSGLNNTLIFFLRRLPVCSCHVASTSTKNWLGKLLATKVAKSLNTLVTKADSDYLFSYRVFMLFVHVLSISHDPRSSDLLVLLGYFAQFLGHKHLHVFIFNSIQSQYN